MPPLDLSPEDFHRLAGRVSEAATMFLATLDERRTFPDTTAEHASAIFETPAPEHGLGDAAVDDLLRVPDFGRGGNGRSVAYVLGSGEPVGAIADLFASVLNQNVTAWRSSPAGTTIERTVVRWIAEGIGCEAFTGSLTSGGSTANLMGLAMAREAKAPANEHGATPGIVYTSTESHMSMAKAVAVLGLGRANLRLIPVDDRFRMRVDALAAAIAEDREAGSRAIAVVASAGTTNTGAIDPLGPIAELARANDLWLHVDGAYGGLAALAIPDRFDGMAEADSISLDAHKWLYQPLDCSVFLFRDAAVARDAFAYTADYTRPLFDDPDEAFAFFEESIELSRRFRALKLWLSLRYHGLEAFREAMREDLRHARLLADLVEREPELELLAPVELSAVCFRWNGQTDGQTLNDRNKAILQRIVRRGRVLISNATLDGTFALRACFVNHRTTDDDVAAIVDEVLLAARELAGVAGGAR